MRAVCPRVVQGHGAVVDLLDALEQQLWFLVRGLAAPVAGPDVGAEHDEAGRLGTFEQGRGRGEARKRKKGVLTCAPPVRACSSARTAVTICCQAAAVMWPSSG
jgi:hypothetical protein